ncbi:DEAD/DEAH box helicase [Paraclostridium bifermentans]|uniref:DEAD/DEAH box helicase n=1 Tax=Paraclostridium bifermentans TaxID=1490 RepID=UPI00359C1AE6
MTNKFTKFNLDNRIEKAIFNMGYKNPSEVQTQVIPSLIHKENVVVKSKTGSGKTASFGIPICEMVDVDSNSIQALIIVPTRELSIQVKNEISNIGRLKKVRCSAIFGKDPIKKQINELKQRVHIVIATPGRIIDHINRGTINLSNIKYFIIDEADKMLNKGFVDDMEFIFNKLPITTTIGLFSATIDEEIKHVYEKHMNNYKIIEIEINENIDKKQIEEKLIIVENKDKYDTLKQLIYINNPKTTIIFLNTRDEVIKLYNKMKKDKFLVTHIHGEMSQEKRIYSIQDFKNGKYNILVSTDVASRGIHIDDVSLVINYHVPRDKENYIHRIGRTGRKDKYGKAITIANAQDDKYVKQIKEYINRDIDLIEYIDEDNMVKGKIKFEEKCRNLLKNKKSNLKNNNSTHSEITRIYLNAGKKKKIRVIDIVGALNNIDCINNEDIGVIEVCDLCSYVDILNYKGERVLKKYKNLNIKKKLVKIKKDNSEN